MVAFEQFFDDEPASTTIFSNDGTCLLKDMIRWRAYESLLLTDGMCHIFVACGLRLDERTKAMDVFIRCGSESIKDSHSSY